MKNLLKKLLALFKSPAPNKPVQEWPFPAVSEDFAPRRKPGRPKKTESSPVKKETKKKQAKKIAVKKSVKKAK